MNTCPKCNSEMKRVRLYNAFDISVTALHCTKCGCEVSDFADMKSMLASLKGCSA